MEQQRPDFDIGFPVFAEGIFRIEVEADGKPVGFGTGFSVAKGLPSKSLILATAKHVLDVPHTKSLKWRVAQYDSTGQKTRSIEFDYDAHSDAKIPYNVHNKFDIGLLTLPAIDAAGVVFDDDEHLPYDFIELHHAAAEATQIGWAGYPGFIEQAFGHPRLCYYEGVVSSLVDLPDRKLYIADGHAARGVSGGPVWYWNTKSERFEIIGIVTTYDTGEQDLIPGLCYFEPINTILALIKHWNAMLEKKRSGRGVDSEE